jgi:hypothetical protein
VALATAMLEGTLDVRLHYVSYSSLVSGTAFRRKAAGASGKEPEIWDIPVSASLAT